MASRRVVAALKLQDDPDFNSLLNGMGTLGKLKIKLGFGDDPRLKTPEERALTAYNSDLTVYPVPGSNVVAIKVSANNAEDAATIANTRDNRECKRRENGWSGGCPASGARGRPRFSRSGKSGQWQPWVIGHRNRSKPNRRRKWHGGPRQTRAGVTVVSRLRLGQSTCRHLAAWHNLDK